VQLPDSDRLPVRHLAGAFRRTTNSYKFYWLLAILRHLGDGGDREVPVSDLVARMIAAVWYPVNYFRLSFGKQDRLERLVERIRAVADAPDDATRRTIRRAAGDVMQSDADVSKNVRSLDRYVPFRFLTPWFADKLRGMRDYKKNDRIEELADASFSGSAPALYRFVGGGDDEDIELHPRWTAYLHRHQRIARDFCLWNLLGYLRDKNPNVPNIAEKLLRPQARKLGGTPRKFWNLALDAHSDLRCPYSGAPLEKGAYDIDHFVPWSFVTHDLLWNLAPTAEAANRSKSDALPDLDAYFDHFAALQRAGFEAAFAEYKERWLEDYALLFGDELSVIHAMDESDFHDRLHERITPLMQIAANTGFPTNWTYQNS
jgi:5-methylcytosine-specific restriction endonuclease McrA